MKKLDTDTILKSEKPLTQTLHFLDAMIPEVISRAVYRPKKEAKQILEANPSMIPITVIPAVQLEEYKVVWLDVGDCDFSEWKFRYSIENIGEGTLGKRQAIKTDLIDLQEGFLLSNSLQPKGFIFQMSLCGSTLLGRALAQSPHNVVMNESTPLHEGLWQYSSAQWKRPLQTTPAHASIVKNLVLALGRTRIPEHQHYFMKFRSWNVIFMDFIMKAFPNTPCLFLYRDPAEIVMSAMQKDPTGYLRFKEHQTAAYLLNTSVEETTKMSNLDYYVALYKEYFLSVVKSAYKNIVYVNYRNSTRENFPEILSMAFGHKTSKEQLELMQSQFDYYSKDDSNKTIFTSDDQQKRKAITPEIKAAVDEHLRPLYEMVEKSDKNLAALLADKAL